MRTLHMPARRLVLAATLLALAACEKPPESAYATLGTGRGASAAGQPAGTDTQGQACTVQPGRAPTLDSPVLRAQEAFCGSYTLPVARVVSLSGPADAGTLDRLAAASLWRQWLEERVTCQAPQPTRLSDGTPARLMNCTRRAGGWPHLALVAAGPDGPIVADATPSALPVVERAIGGRSAAGATAAGGAGGAATGSDALRLAVQRLSTQAFSSGDIGKYERLMVLGRELNLAENFAGAEDAYRAALAIQERVIGPGKPDTVAAVTHLALNLSNQERFQEAGTMFRRADALAPGAADKTARARLLHYEALHVRNQGNYAEAAAMLARAEAEYALLVPASVLQPGAPSPGGFGMTTRLEPSAQAAAIGIAEVRRNRAAVLAHEGDNREAQALVTSSRQILRRVGAERGSVAARSLRTEATTISRGGGVESAASMLLIAAQRFRQAVPGERPEAITLFLAGERWQAAGRSEDALQAFRAGAEILRARQVTLTPAQVLPYLDALSVQAARSSPAEAAQLRREMFAAAQLAQRGQTVRFVSLAAARLGTAGSDPRVSEAVRGLQDLDQELRELFAERDSLVSGGSAASLNALDARIAERQTARAEAEAGVAAAAPGYRQLLLASANADSVARSLAPQEVLVHMLLGAQHGHVLVLDPTGRVAAGRTDLGEESTAALVRRIRSSIETGEGSRPFDTEAAHELYRRLLGPVAPALAPAEALVVVPDGPLMAMPFSILLTEPARPDDLRGAAWLLRKHRIIHAPSPQALVTIRAAAPASTAARPYVGFADFVPPSAAQLAASFPADRCAQDARLAAGLGRLPGSRPEVQFAARYVGASEADLRFGAAFTEDGLRAANLGQYRVVHLATHGLLPGELSCIREPSIVVSPKPGARDAATAFLGASDILTLKLDADLVILSACNTAGTATGLQGRATDAGEAVSSLARSFFFAGARGLLVTHWEVPDRAAAITVSSMMRRQQESGDSATALRGAQLLLLDEAGQNLPAAYAHPYFWASFALIGDGRRGEGAPRIAGAGESARRPL